MYRTPGEWWTTLVGDSLTREMLSILPRFNLLKQLLGNNTESRGFYMHFPRPTIDEAVNTTLPLNMTRLAKPMFACRDADPSMSCTCTDCAQSCPAVPPILQLTGCHVGATSWECVTFGVVLAYVIAAVFIVAYIAMRCLVSRLRRRAQSVFLDREDQAQAERQPFLQNALAESGDDLATNASGSNLAVSTAAGSSSMGSLVAEVPSQHSRASTRTLRSAVDDAGADLHYTWFVDDWLRRVFYKLGLLTARNPIAVLILSITAVAALSTGWLRFDVETNPVNLWVDPASEALAQKNFFDEKFAPFYRVTQLIVERKDGGPIMDREVLTQAWDLFDFVRGVNVTWEERVSSATAASDDLPPVTANTTVTLSDLCFKVQDDGGNMQCVIQSFTNWYAFFGRDQFNSDPDLSVIHKCVTQYGNKDCFALQPTPPNLVLGGVTHPSFNGGRAVAPKDADFMNARSVVFTFLLDNKLKNATHQEMAVMWERKLLAGLMSKDGQKLSLLNVAISTEVGGLQLWCSFIVNGCASFIVNGRASFIVNGCASFD